MQKKNICKFVQANNANTLNVVRFVLESDKDIMQLKSKLVRNRVMLVIEGQGEVVVNEKYYDVSIGTIIFMFAGENTLIQKDKNLQVIYIEFDGNRSSDLFFRFNINSNNRVFDNFESIIPMWKESLVGADVITIDLAAESVLLYAFSKLKRQNQQKESISKKMIEITKERFTDSSFGISLIAKQLSYNPKYLSHTFKKEMNVSYTEYLQDTRLRYAIFLLDNGIDSIKNVALLSGFSDPLYFSTVFKKRIKQTPKEYISAKNKEQ